jgi:hypothetical protein
MEPSTASSRRQTYSICYQPKTSLAKTARHSGYHKSFGYFGKQRVATEDRETEAGLSSFADKKSTVGQASTEYPDTGRKTSVAVSASRREGSHSHGKTGGRVVKKVEYV